MKTEWTFVRDGATVRVLTLADAHAQFGEDHGFALCGTRELAQAWADQLNLITQRREPTP